ncbi:MAG: LPS export ABC transporter permease LptG [Pseudomonadota bacterium]
MIGRTFGVYIALRFLRSLLFMVLGLAFLIVSVDFIEQLRKASGIVDVSMWDLYLIALLRAPLFVEKAFPFACLFAAMMTLTQMNTKMELVVARAAGVSAWQFLLPISLSAAATGVLLAGVYNPLAVHASQKAKDLAVSVFSQGSYDANRAIIRGYWIKQEDIGGGHTIINAETARRQGSVLDNVKILRFDSDGKFLQRIDAANVIHRGDHWMINSASVIAEDGNTTANVSTKLPTSLTRDELLGKSGKPEEISFWDLREVAERVEKSGTNGKPYLVQYHSLTALPAFLFAMVLVAAGVCLRFVRFGQVGRMILGGILCGFVLYTVTSLITALGSNGVVPPVVAAWSPGFVAILFGMSVLLHQEDG